MGNCAEVPGMRIAKATGLAWGSCLSHEACVDHAREPKGYVMLHLRSVACSMLLISISAAWRSPLFADGGARFELSPKIQEVLKWFPKDTESLVAAQLFTFPDNSNQKIDKAVDPFWQSRGLGAL